MQESGQSRAAMDASEYIVKLETSLRSKTLQVEELRKSLEELQAKGSYNSVAIYLFRINWAPV